MSLRVVILIGVTFACLARPARSAGQDLRSPANASKPAGPSGPTASIALRKPKRPDSNRKIYFKNKLEFSLDVGWLPINIPFVFDFITGDPYELTPLKYTLAPIISSVRWDMGNIRGPLFLRGNTELSFGPSFTMIPRGAETRYAAIILGMRRNFIQPNWKIVPYFDGHAGLGMVDAKGPHGVLWAQGQNFTFTIMMGSGVRYNFNPNYAVSFGFNYMHISNLYLSQPRFPNYGINVYGPMIGLDIRLGRPKLHY